MNQIKIDTVKNRIAFVNDLTILRDNFKGMHLIEHNEGNGWTHPYRHFSALQFYLLLTCFDILGSNDEFIPFSAWLVDTKRSKERNQIFNNATENQLVDKIKTVHSAYNKIYGPTQGFKRFINTVLSSKNKEKLLESLRVRKISKPANVVLDYTASETQKIDFLFEIRNSFTHAGQSYASSSGGLFKDADEGHIIDGKIMWGYEAIYWVYKETHYYEYSVRKWPSTLIEIIEDTIKAK